LANFATVLFVRGIRLELFSCRSGKIEVEYHRTLICVEVTGFWISFMLVLKQPGTQHVKPPAFLLLVLVDESGLFPLLSGLSNLLKTRARVLKRTRSGAVFIGLNSL
jgi:hypothetical protein